MKIEDVHLTVYPTPAPMTAEVLFETDILSAIKQQGAILLRNSRTTTVPLEKIEQYFTTLLNVMDLTQHIELSIEAEVFDYEGLLNELKIFFPQFVWTKIGTEAIRYGRKNYHFSFIPLVVRKEGFPLEVHFPESLHQQFPESKDLKDTMIKLIQQRIIEKQLIQEKHFEKKIKGKQQKEAKVEEKDTQNGKEKEKQTTEIYLKNKQESHPNVEFLQVQEEVKREKYVKDRFKIANEKLEMLVEQLELSMIQHGLSYFEHQTVEEDEHWDKRMVIDLREYTYLLQKAKYLEQVWRINDHLVNKSEKMTVTENSLVYEREQVKQLKANISPEDIYFVIYECQVIESRVKIHHKPWFRKPYVKLMKMDYDNLLSKATYFDLLQGESFVIEKNVQKRQPKTAALDEEVG